jgi:hypothetical protein
MKIGKNAPEIFQYPIMIKNTEGEDETYKFTSFEMGKIVDRMTKKLEVCLGKFIHSGFNIWTTQQIHEDYIFDTRFMGVSI